MTVGFFKNIWELNRGKLISYLVLAFSLLVVGYLIRGQKEILARILDINIYQFLIISFIVILTPFIDGLRTIFLTKQFGVKLNISEAVALSCVNNFWNYLPLTGGLVIRSLYLKKRHGFSYSNFLATTAASYIISFLSFGLVGLFSILLLWRSTGVANLVVVSILLLTVLFSVVMIKINFNFNFKNRFLLKFVQIIDGWKNLRKQKDLILKLITLDFALIGVFALRLFLAAQFLGISIPPLGILIIVSLSLFAVLLNITPGALVIKEAIISLSAAALSYNLYDALTISLLDRAVSMIWIFLMGVVFSFYLTRLSTKKR